MKSFQERTGLEPFQFVEYIVKCIVGICVGYGLYVGYPEYSDYMAWIMISVLMVITHDNNNQVAVDRIKGNIVGSVIGFLIYIVYQPTNLWMICVGIAIVITCCAYLKIITVCRTALAAYVIVVMFENRYGTWQSSVYRMLSVIAGAIIGLLITYTFTFLTKRLQKNLSN